MNFIKEYDKYRKEGNDEFRAFALVAKKIAVFGTMDDLLELYDHHNDDFLQETERFLNKAREDLNIEENRIVKSKVS